MSAEQKDQQQLQAENKATGEMCDRIRNQGTMGGMVVISHADLETMIQKRIKEAQQDILDALGEISGRRKNTKPCV